MSLLIFSKCASVGFLWGAATCGHGYAALGFAVAFIISESIDQANREELAEAKQ